MPQVKFKVITNYKLNSYQIKAEDESYSKYNKICTSLGECMTSIYKITRDLQARKLKAVFTFE